MRDGLTHGVDTDDRANPGHGERRRRLRMAKRPSRAARLAAGRAISHFSFHVRPLKRQGS